MKSHSGTWIGPVIEKGVPLPVKKKRNRELVELMKKMEPGDSVRVDHMTTNGVSSLAQRVWGAGFYTLRKDLGGHRLWRGRYKEKAWA